MKIKINETLQLKKGFEESFDDAYKTEITVTLTNNEKRPVTVSYVNTRKDDTTYTNGETQYALKKHVDGNYYINLNVGMGYKKLKLNINELVENKTGF